MDFQIGLFFCFVDSKEEVFASHYFFICGLAKSFLIKFILEILKNQLLLDNLIDLRFYLFDLRNVVVGGLESFKDTSLLASELQLLEVLLVI